MKRFATLAALTVTALLVGCNSTQNTAAAPGAVGAKSECCSTKTECTATKAAPGAVSTKSGCCSATKTECTTTKSAPGAVSGTKSGCCAGKTGCSTK